MDGRGRIAQSLNFIARLRARPPTGGAPPRRDRARASFPPDEPMVPPTQLQWLVQRTWHRLIRLRVPRGAGVAAATIIILSGLGFGVVRGGHLPEMEAFLAGVRDQA